MTFERDYATAPLNDPANVGRYVWASWNSNKPKPAVITKVTRHHIHVGGTTLKVGASGHEASNAPGEYDWLFPDFLDGESAVTDEARTAALAHALLVLRARAVAWHQVSTQTLEAVLQLVDAEVPT